MMQAASDFLLLSRHRLPYIGMALLFSSITSVYAQTSADVKTGESIASNGLPPAVAACASCHGAKGEGLAAFPPLAGQGAAYLQAQLTAFAAGTRKNAVMEPVAKALKEQDKANLAAYFASLPSGIAAPKSAPVPDPKDAGAWLALRGRMAEGIPACASCHGPHGEGVGEHFPAIGKLNAAYMQSQIDAWKQGSRDPGPLELMQHIAKKLSNQDVQAIAQFYAKQSNPAQPASSK